MKNKLLNRLSEDISKIDEEIRELKKNRRELFELYWFTSFQLKGYRYKNRENYTLEDLYYIKSLDKKVK